VLGITPGARPVQEQTPGGGFVVLVVIDGARPSYLTLAGLPQIGALMEQGVVYEQAWVGEMESATPSVHATLGTGTLPSQNGFVRFGWVQPGTREQVDFRTLLAEGKIDPVLQHLPLPSVAARLERLVPGAVALAASGHRNYAVAGLAGGAAKYQLYGQFVGKEYVPRCIQQLGVLSRTTFIITSDHAMMASLPIPGWTETVRTAVQAEHAAVARIDGSTGAIWLQNAAQAKAVAQRLVTMHPPHVNAVFYRSAAGVSYHYVQASPKEWLSTATVGVAL